MNRRALLAGAASLIATSAMAQPFVLRARKMLTGPWTVMVGQGAAYPTISALFYDLQAHWDLAGQNVTAMLMDDQQHAAFTAYGLLPGQITPDAFTIRSSSLGRSSIVAGPTGSPLAMAYGAQLRLDSVELGSLAGQNDTIMMGQGSKLVMGSEVRLIQQSSANFISMAENCLLDVYGNIYVQGQGQCFLTIDMGCQANWVNNGQPNMLAMFLEPGGAHGKPYWQFSFLNPRGGSIITIQAVDYHGTADGYRYVVDKGGVLDVDLKTHPDGLDRLPGSAGTFQAVQGTIF
jgi:hypothetical protein